MSCQGCGRVLKNQKSRELGYGPVCYKKAFGSNTKRKDSYSSADDFPYYEIPGQMEIEDYLNGDGAE